VLHHDRVKERFGDNRRFIRCDEFPVSRAHFLARLSKATGADVENPEDLSALRSSLSSRKMVLFLDNAESILDPQGPHAREIYAVVEQLSRFSNICLGITSRISTVPPRCKRLTIPTLSAESACHIFYGIYNNGRSNIIRDLVKRLDFHALSITLLATTASHNMWDYDRLAKEWDTHRTRVLRTDYNESLAATIELTLASPTFRKLGAPPTFRKLITFPTVRKFFSSPMLRTLCFDARQLLEIVAFFPQGTDENNLDWLFPTIPDRKNIFDKFCILSLTHRINGFITMLAPIRDYFSPLDPRSSPLLCAVKDRYFTRLSVHVDPDGPEFKKAQWITSEDVNVEHLLNVFTSIDSDSADVWDACDHFMTHLYWHKPRQTVLRAKIEGLPEDHPSKPGHLFKLSRLFASVGDPAEQKRLLILTLKLERRRGDDHRVARTLMDLSDANRMLGLPEQGIPQVKEALRIYERSGHTTGQTKCLNDLARLLFDNKQLDAAKEAATRAIHLLPLEGQEFQVCQSHRVLGNIYRSKGKRERAIHHYEVALGIASPFNWLHQLFWVHHSLALLHLDEDKFDGAHVHIKRAKSHAVDNSYNLGRAMEVQAQIWYRQRRFQDATSEALRAKKIYGQLGATNDLRSCRALLQNITKTIKRQAIKDQSNLDRSDSGSELSWRLASYAY
jgi:tetratricopeptide (TPR) repeat protein